MLLCSSVAVSVQPSRAGNGSASLQHRRKKRRRNYAAPFFGRLAIDQGVTESAASARINPAPTGSQGVPLQFVSHDTSVKTVLFRMCAEPVLGIASAVDLS